MIIRLSESEFVKLARQGNVIPVYGELLADLETPVSAFLKLDDGRFSYLLESVEGAEKVARFSFLGSRPRILLTSAGRHVEVSWLRRGKPKRIKRFETRADPLVEVQRLMRAYRYVPVSGLPRFTGGLVGDLGYNVVRFLEPRLPPHPLDDLRLPDIMLMLTDTMVIFDHAQHKLLLVVNAMTQGQSASAVYRRAVRQIHRMAEQLRRPGPSATPPPRRRAPA